MSGSIKLEKVRFEQILQQASIFSKAKPLLEPIKLVFKEDGLHVAMSDQSKTLAVVAHYTPGYFEEYNIGEGEYIVSAYNLVKAMKKVMKGVPFVEVEFKDDNIIVKGESITIKDAIRAQEIVNVEKYDEVEGLYVPNKDNVYAIYSVELPELASLDFKEVMEFTFGKTIKVLGRMAGTVEITKDLTIRPLKEPEKEIVGKYSADYVNRVVKLFKTAGLIAVLATKEEENIVTGPIIIGNKYETYTVSYWINSMVA